MSRLFDPDTDRGMILLVIAAWTLGSTFGALLALVIFHAT